MTTRLERCKTYLEQLINNPINQSSLHFRPGKMQVQISDIDLFHVVAQFLELSKLNKEVFIK